MQLTGPRRIRESLTVATCSLLSIESAHAGYFDYASLWNIDTALLLYSEQNRVNVVEPVLQIKKEISEGEFVTVKLVYDAMSGSTPNGAAPSSTAQSFSSPSGESKYIAAAHKLPLVAFTDARAAVSADWDQPLSRTLRGQYNANFSRETDYSSMGASASLLWDVNNKLTTLTAGVAASFDNVKPTGGLTTELSPTNSVAIATNKLKREIEDDGEGGGSGGSRAKNTYDLLVGITQVLTRRTLMQLNYSYGKNTGYLTDPYKILSVVDGSTGTPVTSPGGGYLYLHEKRPDTRTRNTLYWKTVYHLPEDVIHMSYRYYRDDWEIKSSTVDLTYRLQLGAHVYLEPHYRYYTQTAANFFTHAIAQGATPVNASADLRLAALTSNTVGLRFAHQLDSDTSWGLGVDYMRQSGDAHPANAIGALKNEALFSDLKTMSITADVSMKF